MRAVADALMPLPENMRSALLVELLRQVETHLSDPVESRTFLRRLADRINFRLRDGNWLV